MSSRVQKGGQKFKPVVKPRGLAIEVTTRRQPSARATTVDSHRAISTQPREEQSQITRPSLASLETVAVSEPDQVSLVNKPPKQNAQLSSASIGEDEHAIENIGLSSSKDLTLSSTRYGTAIPVDLLSRPQQIQMGQGSRSTIANEVSNPEPSEMPEPTLHSLISASQSGSDNGNTLSSTPTLVGLQSTEPSGSEVMNRNRKASKKSMPSSEAVEASTTENRTSRKASRRSRRVGPPTSPHATTQGQLDVVSNAEDTEPGSALRQKRRRPSTTASSSTSTRGRRSQNPSTSVIFDQNADPGEDLDPTIMTMAAICNDTGQGRVSSKAALVQRNYMAWKSANTEKRERMRVIMEAKKYGKKDDDDGAHGEGSQPVKEAVSDDNESQVAGSTGSPAVEDASGSGFNYKESVAANRFTAQVRLGPNGETIVDEESLYVDRAENVDDGTDAYQHVEESDQTKFTNSASYGRRTRGSRWSTTETELFYDALSQFGENYELISYVLPGRDRKACKAKFKAEDRRNPNRITYCLNNRVPYDLQTLSRMTGKDFTGPTPEIITPEPPILVEDTLPELQAGHEQPSRTIRKKSRTPAVPEDVEVVGDIESFDQGDTEGRS